MQNPHSDYIDRLTEMNKQTLDTLVQFIEAHPDVAELRKDITQDKRFDTELEVARAGASFLLTRRQADNNFTIIGIKKFTPDMPPLYADIEEIRKMSIPTLYRR